MICGQSDTLLLADVHENQVTHTLKYELDPAYFSSAPGLARGACLKKTEIELELLKIKDMILLVEKYIRGGMCHAIH